MTSVIYVLIAVGMIAGSPQTSIVSAFPTKSACELGKKEIDSYDLKDSVESIGTACVEVHPVVRAEVK